MSWPGSDWRDGPSAVASRAADRPNSPNVISPNAAGSVPRLARQSSTTSTTDRSADTTRTSLVSALAPSQSPTSFSTFRSKRSVAVDRSTGRSPLDVPLFDPPITLSNPY